MKKTITVALVIVAGAIGAYELSRHSEGIQAEVSGRADDPVWLEADSADAINRRIMSDFSLTLDEAKAAIRERHPEVTDADIDTFLARH